MNFQLNGLAVVLYRVMKASRVCFSLARLAKSLGVTAFFWMMEKKISANGDLVQPGGVYRVGIAQSLDGFLPAVVGAVVHDDEHPAGAGAGSGAHDLVHQGHERGDPGGLGAGGGHFAGVHVQGGQQRGGAFALVFVLDAHRLPGRGWAGGVDAGAGLDGGLGVDGDDAVAWPQRLALPEPLAEVEDDGHLGGEVWVAGEDPRLVPPELDRVLGEDPAHAGGRDRADHAPRAASPAASSGQLQRASGTPVTAGSWQASAQTSARSSSLIRRGRPVRGRSDRPSNPRAVNRPRHLRTVSQVMPRRRAIAALA